MSQKDSGRPVRKTRAKRAPRPRKGKSIIFRVTDDEDTRLRAEAGELGVSGYIRLRVFGGGARNRDALRKIAALHVIGRQVQRLADDPAADPQVIAVTLGYVRDAITRLAEEMPEVDENVAPS